jgi:hypothetical protein
MKKRIILQISAITAICGFFALQSCKKDSVDKPVDSTPTVVKPYISVNGQKFICKTPSTHSVTLSAGDSLLTWSGTGTFDTILFVRHQKNEIKVGTFKIDSSGFGDVGQVAIALRWGTNISSPSLQIATGTYELKRENGKYVSYLKNGEAYNGNDHKDRFYNIEFKVIWPY